MKRYLAPGRHLPLLLSLVTLFVLYPLMLEVGRVRLMRFGFLLVLLIGAYGLMDRRRYRIWALVLAVPAMLGQMVAYAGSTPTTLLAATATGLLFLTFVLIAVLVSVLGGGKVTSDKIAGAIAVYLLIGLVFALAYGLVAIPNPAAFEGIEGTGEIGNPPAEYSLVYYSFVTLTTLGYGDILPLSPVARALAWMEAVVGQLFLAILIARLVGMHILHSSKEP